MKKRLLSMLMVVLMVVALLPSAAFAAKATCTHTWLDVDTREEASTVSEITITKDADAKTPGVKAHVCWQCGEVLDYDVEPFVENTKTAPKGDVCKVHQNPVSVDIQEAGCEQAGLRITYCADCGTLITKTTKTGVALDADKLTPTGIKDPDVAKYDGTVRTHNFEFVVVEKPTCFADGWGYAVCKDCGKPYIVQDLAKALELVKTDAQAEEVTELYAQLKHNFKHVTVAIDANHDGMINWAWIGGVRDLFPKMVATHYETVNNQPIVSVDENGNPVMDTVWSWERDKANQRVDVPVPLDSFATGIDNYGMGYYGDFVCANCGTPKYAENYLKDKHPSYSEAKIDKLVFPEALNDAHKCGVWDTDDSVKGYLPYYDVVDGVRVYHDGVTDRFHCQVYNRTFGGTPIPYEEYFAVELLPDGDSLQGYVEPTCLDDGYSGDLWRPATVKADKDGAAVQGWVLVSEGKVLPALGHDWVALQDVAPTCTTTGIQYQNAKVCTRCGAISYGTYYTHNDATVIDRSGTGFEDREGVAWKIVPAKGHDYEWTYLVDPTCANRGISVKACKVCGVMTRMDAFYNFTDEHQVQVVKAVEPGCNSKGYTGDKVCATCGKMIEQGKVLAPNGHKVELADKAPTCTEDGYIQRGICSVCGDVIVEGTVVPALQHHWVVKADGSVVCDRCDVAQGNDPAVEPTEEPTTPPSDKPTTPPTDEPTTPPTDDPVVENPFVDVAEDAYYFDAVLWAVEKEITNGVDATHFAPNAACTRAQMVTFLWRCAGSPVVEAENPFTDVAEGSYYYNAVLWAVSEGITKGTSADKFSPNATVTRAQVVTFLYRFDEEPAVEAENPFADVAEGAYYFDAVVWAVENGITTGKTATSFAPNDACTRAQIVTFMFRDFA